MPFAGLRVLSLESRRAKEMETLIRRERGDPFVAPSVQERALEDHGEALHFLERLEAGEFDLLICMTGTGLSFWRDQVASQAGEPGVARLGAALARLTIVARGPKPLPLLRELGVRPTIVVPEPNTWREIVDVIQTRPERRIAVQEYGRPNLEMNAALERLGAAVTPLVMYRWELPVDLEPLQEAALRLARREVDVVLFTSSIQLDHLLMIARESGIDRDVLRALREDVAVASVGPIMSDTLEAAGIPVDIAPVHPKMMALVRAASEETATILRRKMGSKDSLAEC